MTQEEFFTLAVNPPIREEKTIFEVSALNIEPLYVNMRKSFTRFPVMNQRIGYSDTISGAEKIIDNAISKAKESDSHESIYCFYICEYPMGLITPIDRYGFSKRLYDNTGRMLNQTLCSALERDRDTPYGRFHSRSPEKKLFSLRRHRWSIYPI